MENGSEVTICITINSTTVEGSNIVILMDTLEEDVKRSDSLEDYV